MHKWRKILYACIGALSQTLLITLSFHSCWRKQFLFLYTWHVINVQTVQTREDCFTILQLTYKLVYVRLSFPQLISLPSLSHHKCTPFTFQLCLFCLFNVHRETIERRQCTRMTLRAPEVASPLSSCDVGRVHCYCSSLISDCSWHFRHDKESSVQGKGSPLSLSSLRLSLGWSCRQCPWMGRTLAMRQCGTYRNTLSMQLTLFSVCAITWNASNRLLIHASVLLDTRSNGHKWNANRSINPHLLQLFCACHTLALHSHFLTHEVAQEKNRTKIYSFTQTIVLPSQTAVSDSLLYWLRRKWREWHPNTHSHSLLSSSEKAFFTLPLYFDCYSRDCSRVVVHLTPTHSWDKCHCDCVDNMHDDSLITHYKWLFCESSDCRFIELFLSSVRFSRHQCLQVKSLINNDKYAYICHMDSFQCALWRLVRE